MSDDLNLDKRVEAAEKRWEENKLAPSKLLRDLIADWRRLKAEQQEQLDCPITCRNGFQHDRYDGCIYCALDDARHAAEMAQEERP